MSDGFKPEYFERLARLEAKNFWFRVRNKIIVWAFNKYTPSATSYLEIGCGTGFVTQAIATKFPAMITMGSDYFPQGLEFARKKSPTTQFFQMDARDIPYHNKFSTIGAFDVLEHIEEHETVLHQLHKALIPGGTAYITVPQYDWLWSVVDDYACHVRRYRADELHALLAKCGFEVVRSTSFMSILLPLMLLSRWLQKDTDIQHFNPEGELKINPILNRLLECLMSLDVLLIRLGFNLPFGGSRLVVARKR